MNIKKILIFTILFTSTLFSESRYPYRDIRKPIIQLPQGVTVYISTPARTGSTLLWNIMTYLFEDRAVNAKNSRVKKTHEFTQKTKKNLIFTSIRDPLDIYASLLNMYKFTHSQLKAQGYCPMVYNDADITFVYEKLANNQFEYIFDILEQKIEVSIPVEEKKKIIKYFNTDSVKKITKRLPNKSKGSNTIWHPVLLFHKTHINNSDWRTSLDYKLAKALYKKTYKVRKAWGYPDIDIDAAYGR